MTSPSQHRRAFSAALLPLLIVALSLLSVSGQWPFATPTTPQAQRNALSAVRSQVGWVQNATRSASTYGAQGYGSLAQQFDGLRQAWAGLKSPLNPNQLAYGANALAELDAGLDIIQEAFADYQADIAGGQNYAPALSNLCRVLREGSGLWLQQLNKVSGQLRIGWGG